MGAYGSPDLPPNNDYKYSSPVSYQDPYKPQKEKSGCLHEFFIALGLIVVFLTIFGIVGFSFRIMKKQVNQLHHLVSVKIIFYQVLFPFCRIQMILLISCKVGLRQQC